MKSIIKSLVIIVAAAAIAGGATYAYFSSSVVVNGITMTSGNADLQISSNINTGFVDGINLTDADNAGFKNLYPGQDILGANGYTFYLKNSSTSNIGLDTYFKVETVSGDYGLCNAIKLKLVRSGGYETDWHSLCDWRDNITSGKGWRMQNTATDQEVIPQNEVHGWTAYAQVDPNAGNEIQGKSLGLKITFLGEQHH